MPGMGGFGTETIGGFYPYLLIDLVIIVGLVWLAMGIQIALPHLSGGATPAEPAWADRTEAPSIPARLFLRRAIGIIWIVDGLLQAQPAMPGGFVKNIISPTAQGQPGWLANLLHWESYFWQAHPLDLAVATVLMQVGIGVMILAGGDSILGKVGLWLSIGWGLFVWVGGEATGGLFISGATEMMGAPGAALVYVAAAGLLLAPLRLWTGGMVGPRLRRAAGAVLLFGAVLQAIPWEGFWRARGLSAMFLSMAKVPQPGFLSAPVLWIAHLAEAYPFWLNLSFVLVMAALGIALVVGLSPGTWTAVALVWLAFIWWVGQDFGALGSKTATDPNLSPLLAVMLVTAWLARRPVGTKLKSAAPQRSWRLMRRHVALAGMAAIAVGLVPAMLGLPVAGAQSSTIEALNTGGPLSPISGQRMPDLTLINQSGQHVDLRQWSSRAVVVTFLDPVCFDACPVIAEQMAAADHELGPLAKHVEFIAIVSNPIYRSLSVVRSFDSELGLEHLSNWQYLTGSLPQLERAWADFDITIELPRLEMVEHPTLLYFIKPGGEEVSLAQDETLSNASLITSYASLIVEQVRAITPQ
jgi:cytochrome oxidase Cu insertion factor (SCO1/SenC/PrrC family)